MAKVFLTEDDAYQRGIIRGFLETGRHEVVLETGDFNEALVMVKRVRELGIDLAVLDGSLRPQSPRDGEEITAVLRKEVPGIKIIGVSGLIVNFGDANLRKPVKLKELLEAISKLGL